MEKATAAFNLLDVDSDGELNEDEFIEGCMKDHTLANLLNSSTPNSKERRRSSTKID